jgi:hypothetical protein
VRRLILFAVLVAAACRPGAFRRSPPDPLTSEDSLYWRAVSHLDAANTNGSIDSALHYLNGYLANGTVQAHRVEAMVFRQLARDAQLLGRVQAALREQKTDTVRIRTEARTRDEDSLREIQRLKDQLARANEELERIRKRLANPRPPVDTQPTRNSSSARR